MKRYAPRWLVRVVGGEHAGREFVVVDGDELAACRRVAALLGQSCHLVVANAGVYDRARNDIVSPGT